MGLCKNLIAAASFLGMSTAALAVPVTGQISFAGYAAAIGSVGMGAATGIDFVQGATGSVNPGTAGGLTSFGAGSGSFAGLSCANVGGGCGSIKDLLTFSGGPITSFLTLNTGTSTAVSFDLASITVVTRDAGTNSINLRATGTINYTGLDSTAGTFFLTAQGDNVTSFSATTLATVVPEPVSVALLGASLAVVGLIGRKKG